MPVRSSVSRKSLSPYLLPATSAVLLTLTCYPWRCDWLIWIALAPFFAWLCDSSLDPNKRFKGVLFLGWAYHFSYLTPFLSLGWWGWGAADTQSISRYFAYSRLFMAVLIAGISVWGALVVWWLSLLFARFLKKPLIAVWAVASVWVFLLEYIGHRTVFGFSWGLIGNRLHGCENLRQLASITGVYGLSFIVVAVNTAIAGWIALWWAKIQGNTGHLAFKRASATAATAIAAAMLAACWLYGHLLLAKEELPKAESLNVALLQGSRPDYALEDFTGDGLDRIYAGLLDEALSRPTQLVVMPETVWLRTLQLDAKNTASVTPPVSAAEMTALINRHLQARKAVIVFGIDAVEQDRFYNVTSFWDKTGLLGVYRKRRLVPFAEYRPAFLGLFAPVNAIHGKQFAFNPGAGAQLVQARGVVFGSFICQEVLFPDLARQSVKSGAQVLVTTGNDSVFASPAVAWEQSNLAVLRSVETGRYLLRAMKSGISAIIDSKGRVLAQASINARTSLYGQVHPQSRLTFYTRHGDWLAKVCGIGVLLALILL